MEIEKLTIQEKREILFDWIKDMNEDDLNSLLKERINDDITAKEFVTKKYPKAFSSKEFIRGWYIWYIYKNESNELYIGIGSTENEAWENAKSTIIKY